MLESIEDIIDKYETITIEETGRIQLMNRVDCKFVFHKKVLPAILEYFKDEYKVLLVQKQKVRQYKTQYFDTYDFKMYLQHHNGKLKRYKIRYRTYIESDETFFEIKEKNNKLRTIKKRIQSDVAEEFISENNRFFLENQTQFRYNELYPSVCVSFYRLTLVDTMMKERVTIDLDYEAYDKVRKEHFGQLIILEVKQEQNQHSKLKQFLKENSIYPASFSKYCFAISKLHPELKQNNFKMKYKHINELLYETN